MTSQCAAGLEANVWGTILQGSVEAEAEGQARGIDPRPLVQGTASIRCIASIKDLEKHCSILQTLIVDSDSSCHSLAGFCHSNVC